MTTQLASKKVALENILFATDFSKRSDKALPFVLSIARKYGSTVVATHVHSFAPLGEITPTIELQSIAAQALKEANEKMKLLEPQFRGIPHEFIFRRGDIWNELSGLIEVMGIDMIVV